MTCPTGKVPYPDEATALRTIAEMKRRGHHGGRKRDKLLQPYRCRACGRLHIGHTKRRFLKAQRAAQRGHAA